MENKKNLNVNFKEMLNDTTKINEILNCIDPGNLQVENIISSYEKNNNRFGTIFMAMNYKLEESQKIIIDAINGEPNSNQVKELTYDQGADCAKRIILYTLRNHDYVKNEYRHEQEMAMSFAKVNNDCSLDTFVIEVSWDSAKTYKYDAEVCPDENKWTSFEKLPTKLEFEKAIFRVFYNQTDQWGGAENDHMDDIDDWFSGTFWQLDIDGISFMYPVWDESGLFAQAVSITGKGADDLKSIKENNQKYLRKMFVNRETTFEIKVSGSVTMLIKLWDKPLSFFTKATPADKEKIAEYLRKISHRLDSYWNTTHFLDGSENDDVEEYLAIPEDAFNELEKEVSA